MNYATIKYYDIANGPGVRTSVFVSGCRHHCPGCFNEVAWDFGYGQPFDKPVRNEVFASCKPDYITGLSLLGGETEMVPINRRLTLVTRRDGEAERLTIRYALHRLGHEPAPIAGECAVVAVGAEGCLLDMGRHDLAAAARYIRPV